MRRPKFNSLRKFEVLEDRRMMAGDISYSNGIITIDGAGYDDVVEVRFEGNSVDVDLIAEESDGDTDHTDLDKSISNVSKIVFNGFAGNDTLTVFVNNLNSGVTLNNVVLEFHGGENDDNLFNVLPGGVKTVAFGDAGNDVLQGSKFDDVLEGGAGDDDLSGGAGNDKYVFSGSTTLGSDKILNESANVGTDTLDFTNFGAQVFVDLQIVNVPATGIPYAVTSGNANLIVTLDNATAIENVIGTAYTDGIFGNSRPNLIYGRDGNDYIKGAGGNDTLDGGAGNDTYLFNGSNLGTDTIIEHASADRDVLDFSGMPKGLTVDLTKFGTNYAVNSTDLKLKLSNNTAIEDVVGTAYNDTIIGNSRDNNLSGLDGKDVITGGLGADRLEGGRGDDTLRTDVFDQVFGGLGKDLFDQFNEANTFTNPRPSRYLDWGVF